MKRVFFNSVVVNAGFIYCTTISLVFWFSVSVFFFFLFHALPGVHHRNTFINLKLKIQHN